MPEDLDPWDRQAGESARAFEAFCVYRDMEPTARSLRRVRPRTGHGQATPRNVPGNVRAWAARWTWAERAAAWDAYQERRKRELHQAELDAMAARQAALGRALQDLALSEVRKLAATKDGPALTPHAIARLAAVGAAIERAALGEPERHEVAGPGGGPVFDFATLAKAAMAARTVLCLPRNGREAPREGEAA